MYIHRYFLQSDYTPLWGLRPHLGVIVVLGISSALTAFSEVLYQMTYYSLNMVNMMFFTTLNFEPLCLSENVLLR